MTTNAALLEGITVPDSPDALAEALNDQSWCKDVLKDKDTWGAVMNAYATKLQGEGTDLAGLVEAEVAKQNRDLLIEAGVDVKRPDVRQAVLADPYNRTDIAALQAKALYNKDAIGAQVDGLFKSSADFFNTIWRGNVERDTPSMQEKLQKLRNFASDVPSEGGFLIPETLRSELLRVALETAVVRPRARVVPMETLTVPYPSIVTTTNAGSVYGGLTGYWTEEAGQMAQSTAKFGRVVLSAKKLTIYTEIPSELLTDSLISLTGFINESFPEALSFFEDIAFLTGSGVGEPLGVLNAAAAVSVTRSTTVAGSNIEFVDVVNMFSRMLPQSLPRSVWVASIDSMPTLMQMTLATGNATIPVVSPPLWLTGQQAIGAPPMTILGRPVVFTEKAPALGSAGDLSLIDFGYYLIGDRQAMQARQSDDFKFDTDQVAFRVIERVDGRPWLQSAITPANGSTNTLSPFVTLAAAA